MVVVRPVTPNDSEAWLRMRRDLWPDSPEEHHRNDIERFFSGSTRDAMAVLIGLDESNTPVGFAELNIRPYAEGCKTDRVAFLEGWYVAPEARRQGVGRALTRAAEDWGRAQGCTEFASDTEADNKLSQRAHLALGFEDAGLIRCFRKDL